MTLNEWKEYIRKRETNGCMGGQMVWDILNDWTKNIEGIEKILICMRTIIKKDLGNK